MAFLTQIGESVESNAPKAGTATFAVSQMSQRTLLLRRKREVREVDDALALLKEEQRRCTRACAERRDGIVHKEDELRERVIHFEKFIRENDAKVRRAGAKGTAARRLLKGKRAERRRLEAHLNKLEGELATSSAMLSRSSRSKEYLERIVESSDQEYLGVADVLARLEALRDANRYLVGRVARGDAEMGALRSRLQLLRAEAQERMVEMRSEIGALRRMLDARRGDNAAARKVRERQKESADDVDREVWQVVVGIQNLYERASAAMKPPLPAVQWDRFAGDGAALLSPGELEQTLDRCLAALRERSTDLADIVEASDGATASGPQTARVAQAAGAQVGDAPPTSRLDSTECFR